MARVPGAGREAPVPGAGREAPVAGAGREAPVPGADREAPGIPYLRAVAPLAKDSAALAIGLIGSIGVYRTRPRVKVLFEKQKRSAYRWCAHVHTTDTCISQRPSNRFMQLSAVPPTATIYMYLPRPPMDQLARRAMSPVP